MAHFLANPVSALETGFFGHFNHPVSKPETGLHPAPDSLLSMYAKWPTLFHGGAGIVASNIFLM
jgi:hypothetical protein